jgi:hypothetical protein
MPRISVITVYDARNVWIFFLYLFSIDIGGWKERESKFVYLMSQLRFSFSFSFFWCVINVKDCLNNGDGKENTEVCPLKREELVHFSIVGLLWFHACFQSWGVEIVVSIPFALVPLILQKFQRVERKSMFRAWILSICRIMLIELDIERRILQSLNLSLTCAKVWHGTVPSSLVQVCFLGWQKPA